MNSPKCFDFLIRSKFNFNKAKEHYTAYKKIMKHGLFDKEFYLDSYPHIKKSNMDPLVHYLFYGYLEGKSPSLYFDVNSYLKEFPEVKREKINPLVHYVENKHKGFLFLEDPSIIKKNRIIDTNSLFLNNYKFEEEPLVSIIILNRDGTKHLKRLFKDFSNKTNYDNYEIIVVDNDSSDGSVDYLKTLKEKLPIRIIENNENRSFSKSNNEAAKIANGEYLLLLNNDIEPTYGWLNEMVGTFLNNENVGAVGAKLIFPYYGDMKDQGKSFSIQHAGVKFKEERTPYIYGPLHENMFSTLIFKDNVNKEKECIANTAATLLVKKSLYLELGGFDEGYFYGYEDIDLAFKLYDNGYKTIYCPSALLFHHESATRLNDERVNQLNFENISYFVEKWGKSLFKYLLKDKIENNNFFTNKKLDFSIVLNEESDKDFIYKMAKNLNIKGYDVNLISNSNNLYLGDKCDIVISFNTSYNIDKVVSRLNLIKILVLDDFKEDNVQNYDIVFVKDKILLNKINHENLFLIESADGLSFSKELLGKIENIYLE